MKKQFLLASILGSSILLSPIAAGANEAGVESARVQLKEFEKKYGTQNKDYYLMLANLAQAYHYSGKKKEANECYQKALEQAGKQPDAITRVAKLKNNWANFLLFGSNSISKEDRTFALDLLQEQEKFLEDTNGKANEYLNIAASYYRAKEWTLLQKIESKIQRILDATAIGTTNQNKLVSIINSYFILGSMHVEKKNRLFIGTASNKEELDKASQYFLKTLTLCEHLPPKDGVAISMYRKIAQFFKANGKNDLAAKYTNVLAKSLGSSDPAVLFPPVDLCPACGRG